MKAAKTLLFVLLSVFALSGLTSEITRDVKAQARQTVVPLVDEVGPGEWVGYCSATKIHPKILLTASHCVGPPMGDEQGVLQFPRIFYYDSVDDTIAEGKVIRYDEERDMALILVESVCPCAEIGRAPEVDAPVFAIGFPLADELGTLQVLTEGSYQGEIGEYRDLITAPVVFGNSGGGVFNERGQIIGLVFEVVPATDGMTFWVPVFHLAVMTNYDGFKDFIDGFK